MGWQQYKAMTRRWVLEDTGLSAEEWDNLKYEDVLGLPLLSAMNLIAAGGRVRFPGSDREDVFFTLCCNEACRYSNAIIERGHLFCGKGKDLPAAARSAVEVAVELAGLRGGRQ